MYKDPLKVPISDLRGTFRDKNGVEYDILIPHTYLEATLEDYEPDPWGDLLVAPAKSVYYLRIIPHPNGTAFTISKKESMVEV